MHLVDRFKQTIARRPDAIAVRQEDGVSTYAELGRLCANVAAFVRARGLRSGDRVAMLLSNSVEYIAVFYGIWSAGGTTVALNTQAKARDILNWIEHAGAKWLFIDGGHPELSHVINQIDGSVEIIPVDTKGELDGRWAEIVHADSAFPGNNIDESDVASIIYTSGTTGQPKGVTLSHANLRANVDAILAYLHLTESDSIVNVLPFYYSYGNAILHTHIAVGGKLILENSLLYPHRLIERISNECVTGFSGVPSTFSLLLARVKLEDYDLSALRYITQAGGAMSPTMVDKIIDALPHVALFIMYGQTEACARLSYLPSDKVRQKRGSIGIPIPGVSLQIRDKAGHVMPPYQTGEICAQGQNIMLGYWRDRKQTEKVIIDGWLHTGDLAHYDNDGYLYIDGRATEMIKAGGNRISPKEVEEVIQEIDGVEEVAVIGVYDELLGETIKAYIVPTPGAHIEARMVKFHCRNNLAVYKIPRSIEFIEQLPKTASGKLQRFVLQRAESQTC